MIQVSNPLISVIVPVYNAEKYLARCIDSIINQSYKNLEIILINDGSTDSSSEICKFYQEKDTRIQVIQKENSGPASARNAGLQIYAGEYLCFVDSDDWLANNYVSELYGLIKKYDADIVACEYYKAEKHEIYQPCENPEIRICNNEDFLKICFTEMPISVVPWNKLYKRELYSEIRFPEDKKVCEDVMPLLLAGEQAKRAVVTSNKLYYYYTNPCSLTQESYNPQHENYVEVWTDIHKYCSDKFPNLCSATIHRMILARLNVLNKLTLTQNNELKIIKKAHINYLRANAKFVLSDNWFGVLTKIQIFMIMMYYPLYSYLYKKLKGI